ncbi:PQQ-dependent sugar dehydrogenase [Halomonas organivorans]
MAFPLRPLAAIALLLGLGATEPADARLIPTRHLDVCLTTVASGLDHAWGLAMLPDGRFLVGERDGRLALIDDGRIRWIADLPEVSTRGQGGLLDLALHPDYGDGDHDWLYFTWSRPGPGGTATSLSRARLGEGRLEDLEHLFVQDRFSQPGRHYGSRLAWLPDGTLLMSIGDRGVTPERAQDRGDHAGSFLRLTDTGGVPADNPFVGDPEGLDELFSVGHRNPQGLTIAEDGVPWSTEHGPRTGDELNRLELGVNYGWPEVTLGRDYATNLPIGRDSAPGMRDPVHVFEGRFAPSGLAQVTAEEFAPWHGDFLAGGLRSETLLRLRLEGDEIVEREAILAGQIGRIRTVHQGHDGALYLLNDQDNGSLFRLRPASAESSDCPS